MDKGERGSRPHTGQAGTGIWRQIYAYGTDF